MAESDVLFRAEVDDKTIEFFDRFDRNVDKIAQAAQEGFQNVDQRIQQSGKQIGMLSGMVGGVTTALINMGMQAVGALKQFVSESVNLTARVDTLGVTLNLVGQRAGYTADEIARVEEDVKSMGITTSSARQSLVRMAQANIDWSEASKLARLAQDAAVVAGINSSEAFDRLILGIQKQEPELLRNLGITLDRNAANKAYADTLGITVKEMSLAEKQQATLNEIYRQASVVSGSYEASMGSVGKQITSLPRHIEELKLSLGRAFQPALSEQITFMTERLKILRAWFDDNEEAVLQFGSSLGKMVNMAFTALGKLIDQISRIPGAIEAGGVGLAKIINNLSGMMSNTQLEQNVSNIGTAFKQLVSIIVTSVAASISAVKNMADIIISQLNIIYTALSGGDVDAALDAFASKWHNFSNNIRNDASAAMDAMQDLLFTTQEIATAANDVAVEPVSPIDGDEMQEESDKAVDALQKVNDALASLHKRQMRDAEDRTIRRAREEFEERIRLSWQIEDMERGHQERLSGIRKQYQEEFAKFQEDSIERRLQLEEDRNRKAIEIEERYRQQLQDLQRRFEYQAEELARSRDAVGLLRLMRSHEQALEEERTRRDRAADEAQEDYTEQLQLLEDTLREQEAQIKESFAKQIEEAQEAYKKQQEEFQRNLERQREMKELHRQWEEEDRQRAYARELEDMAEQFADMEGLTEEGLSEILTHWEQYLGDLSIIAAEYREITAEMAATQSRLMSGVTLGSYGSSNGRPLRPTNTTAGGVHYNPTQSTQGIGNQYIPRNQPNYTLDPNAFQGGNRPHVRNTGQAGQVSQLLSDSMASNFFSKLSNIPSVPASSSRDVREIVVRGDIAGMEPIFQRQLVQGLLEIERNRGV